jgi:hypothetical protein
MFADGGEWDESRREGCGTLLGAGEQCGEARVGVERVKTFPVLDPRLPLVSRKN